MSDHQEQYPWDGAERRTAPDPTPKTYNVKDIISTVILVTSALIAVLSAYYNLNNSVEKHQIEADIYRDLSVAEIKEIKESILLLKLDLSKVADGNELQINQIKEQLVQIDVAITQIYQRISKKS